MIQNGSTAARSTMFIGSKANARTFGHVSIRTA